MVNMGPDRPLFPVQYVPESLAFNTARSIEYTYSERMTLTMNGQVLIGSPGEDWDE
jgi:hypothetical protein